MKEVIIWQTDHPDERLALLKSRIGQTHSVQFPESLVNTQRLFEKHFVPIVICEGEVAEATMLMVEKASPFSQIIYFDENADFSEFSSWLSYHSLFGFLHPSMEKDNIESLFDSASEAARLQMNRYSLRKQASTQVRELESLTEGLERIVGERTNHIEDAKREEEVQFQKIRSLVQFMKDLELQNSLEDLYLFLRKDFRKIAKISDPHFIFQTQSEKINLCSYASGQVQFSQFNSEVKFPAAAVNHDRKWAEVLANHQGRPFIQLCLIPLEIKLASSFLSFDCKFVLAFEAPTKEVAKAVQDYISQRQEALNITADRLLLEMELGKSSYRWEMTFESFRNPLAIIDFDYHVLRSNRKFSEDFMVTKCYQTFAGQDTPCEGCPMFDVKGNLEPKKSKIKVKNRVFEVHSYPIKMTQNLGTHVVNQYIDVTQRQELYSRLVQSEKMTAIGQLAGHIAHELNNPLTGLRTMAQILKSEAAKDSSIQSDLNEIDKAAERSHKIIKNLIEFSQENLVEEEDMSLDEIAEKTFLMIKTIIRPHRFEVDLQSSDFKVRVQPQLIQQVLFNLINNSCQAMKEAGTLKVSSGFDKKSKEVYLEVTDTGEGIVPELLEKIFEPFFTTKQEGHGTGLGLSFSKSIIERFGGKFIVKSTKGKGSCFRFYLPVVS